MQQRTFKLYRNGSLIHSGIFATNDNLPENLVKTFKEGDRLRTSENTWFEFANSEWNKMSVANLEQLINAE